MKYYKYALVIVFFIINNLVYAQGNNLNNDEYLQYLNQARELFDQESYDEALSTVEKAINSSVSKSDISSAYHLKGEILRKQALLENDVVLYEKAISAYEDGIILSENNELLFVSNYTKFERTQLIISRDSTYIDSSYKYVNNMWKSLLNIEYDSSWVATLSRTLNDNGKYQVIFDACITAALKSNYPNVYLPITINICDRAKNVRDINIQNYWKDIENWMRFDNYNLLCAANYYMANVNSVRARDSNNRALMYRILNTYYKEAIYNARNKRSIAIIYNDMATFEFNIPFQNFESAVSYAEQAYRNYPDSSLFQKNYGYTLVVAARSIWENEQLNFQNFEIDIKRALDYADKAAKLNWSDKYYANYLASVFSEVLHKPKDKDRFYLKRSKNYIQKAFEFSPDKGDTLILNQLENVFSKFGTEGRKELNRLLIQEGTGYADNKIKNIEKKVIEFQKAKSDTIIITPLQERFDDIFSREIIQLEQELSKLNKEKKLTISFYDSVYQLSKNLLENEKYLNDTQYNNFVLKTKDLKKNMEMIFSDWVRYVCKNNSSQNLKNEIEEFCEHIFFSENNKTFITKNKIFDEPFNINNVTRVFLINCFTN